MQEHEWPKPAWRKAEDGTIECGHFNSGKELREMTAPRTSTNLNGGWSRNYIPHDYPRALHGPKGQSISVRTKAEEGKALANGWTLKPHVIAEVRDEVRQLTHDDAPLPDDSTEDPEDDSPAPKKRGRPAKEVVQ
jgi:hypothetical protein